MFLSLFLILLGSVLSVSNAYSASPPLPSFYGSVTKSKHHSILVDTGTKNQDYINVLNCAHDLISFFDGYNFIQSEYEKVKYKAEQGDAEAQFKYSLALHNRAKETPLNSLLLNVTPGFTTEIRELIKEIFRWLEKSANQNYWPAAHALGCYIATHTHPKVNPLSISQKDILVLFERFATNKNIEAQYYLGLIYLNGIPSAGVSVDFRKALSWLSRAASKGHEQALSTYISTVKDRYINETLVIFNKFLKDGRFYNGDLNIDKKFIDQAFDTVQNELDIPKGLLKKYVVNDKSQYLEQIIKIFDVEQGQGLAPKLKLYVINDAIGYFSLFGSLYNKPSEKDRINKILKGISKEGIPQADYVRYLINQKDEAESFKILSKLVSDEDIGNNGDIQYQYARRLIRQDELGSGNKSEAIKFLKIAEEKGHKQATIELDALQKNEFEALLLLSRKNLRKAIKEKDLSVKRRDDLEAQLLKSKKEFDSQLHSYKKDKELYLLLLVSLSGLLGLAAVIWGLRWFLRGARSKGEEGEQEFAPNDKKATEEEFFENDKNKQQNENNNESLVNHTFEIKINVAKIKKEAHIFKNELEKELAEIDEKNHMKTKNIISLEDNHLDIQLEYQKEYELAYISYIWMHTILFSKKNGVKGKNFVLHKLNGADSDIQEKDSNSEILEKIDKLIISRTSESLSQIILSNIYHAQNSNGSDTPEGNGSIKVSSFPRPSLPSEKEFKSMFKEVFFDE